jgi:hypothetical protein
VPIGRRLSILLLALSVVAAPAVVLRLFCAGSSCDAGNADASPSIPFCSLPSELRRAIVSGFHDGHSPDVMGSTFGVGSVWTSVDGNVRVAWPGSSRTDGTIELPDMRVPIAFFGLGVARRRLPRAIGLDAIAPTLEAVAGLRRPHPEVRTGDAIDAVIEEGSEAPPLLVLIAWKGIGSRELEAEPDAWPFLRGVMRRGTGTLEAVAGSLPLDPAATLTTIGTGALPSTHGITGTVLRDDDGIVRAAWSTRGSGSVVATLADDLDRESDERAEVAAVVTSPADRGIIGDGWYLDARDRDSVIVARPGRAASRVRALLGSSGLGSDAETDLLGVVLEDEVAHADRETARIARTIREIEPHATLVVAGTGSTHEARGEDAEAIAAAVEATLDAPAVEGTTADGFFLDQGVAVERSITAQEVADILRDERSAAGAPLFDDVYPSFAVAFARYC